jgi:hypothetical protein
VQRRLEALDQRQMSVPRRGSRSPAGGGVKRSHMSRLVKVMSDFLPGGGSSMRVADRDLDLGQALGYLREYAVTYANTVRLYDLAGDPDGRPGPGSAAEPVNAVALADIGRLVVINASLGADDVATLMDIDAAIEFTAVPPAARLEDCEPGNDVYQAATALYEKYRLARGSNIGRAKRSKLLHLKRPWLIPIADTRVVSIYRRRADTLAATLSMPDGHWEAVREDLIAGVDDFNWLTTRLCDHQEPSIRQLSRLTNLRLLDILAWMISDT